MVEGGVVLVVLVKLELAVVDVVALVVVFVESVVETFKIVVRGVETVVISNFPAFTEDSFFPSSNEELVDMIGFGGFLGLEVVKMFSD